jgi:hypothetical protein
MIVDRLNRSSNPLLESVPIGWQAGKTIAATSGKPQHCL